MCNPIWTSTIIEQKRKTDLNIVIGLCVAGDSLIFINIQKQLQPR